MTPAELDAIKARREDFRTPYSVSVKDIDALLAYVDELERQLSELTREVEAKTRRLIELERPVSAPPSHRRAPTAAALLGYNAATVDASEPPLAAEPETYVCHCEQSGYPDASCPTHGVKATILLPLLDAARPESEAGITEGPEIAVVVDAELNGHEPTAWTEGGGYA